MAVLASDLIARQAANMPEDDTSTTGGAVNLNGLIEFTPLAANDAVEAVSDNAADTMNLTLTGRNAAGAIVSETLALNGTTVVSFATLGTIERVLKIELASAAAGTVTVRRASVGPTIVAIDAGITSVRRLFYDSASEAGATTRYEKVFYGNANSTDTLNSAEIELTADPATTIRVGCAPSVNDTATVTNRKTAPASVTFVDDNVAQSIPGGVLAAGDEIGVWIEMQRGAGAAAVKNTFTVQVAGTTT